MYEKKMRELQKLNFAHEQIAKKVVSFYRYQMQGYTLREDEREMYNRYIEEQNAIVKNIQALRAELHALRGAK